jgi:peptidoglycan/xylan/chitin deacetylase (PgdA/CDA1 family)
LRRGFILAFHSHNIAGNTYETNDHVALDESLGLLAALGIPVLRLADVVRALRGGDFGRLPARFAAVTLDDGSDYDWRRIGHPLHGPQEPMGAIVRRRGCAATSFVIASPEARDQIAGTDKPYRLSDDWWTEAQASGYFDIGCHGWNHVHPEVEEMRESPELVEAFGNVRTPGEAERQVGQAARFIRERAGHDAARLFAYPYGQVSDYLADEWLPAQDEVLAAFTTVDRPLEADADLWRLPRYVCGWHWKSNDELRAIVSG